VNVVHLLLEEEHAYKELFDVASLSEWIHNLIESAMRASLLPQGTLEYAGCAGQGRGNWLLKPAGIRNGKIFFSARWKVSIKGGKQLIYR
jgi:hypothetical protein